MLNSFRCFVLSTLLFSCSAFAEVYLINAEIQINQEPARFIRAKISNNDSVDIQQDNIIVQLNPSQINATDLMLHAKVMQINPDSTKTILAEPKFVLGVQQSAEYYQKQVDQAPEVRFKVLVE